MKLEGKTALVTGTSPNIMGGIAEELAREGANLVCADIREEYAEKCAAAIVAEGHDAMGVGCDVTDEDQVTRRHLQGYGTVRGCGHPGERRGPVQLQGRVEHAGGRVAPPD